MLLHAPLLSLPYYWDEAGYYIPAAHDFYLSGSLIPHSTVSNPHPPLLSIYLGTAWKLFGFSPLVTRLAMAALAGAAIYALLLLATLLVSAEVALWAALIAIVTPVFFAQSTLAHLDVAATLGTLLCLYFYLRGRLLVCAVAGALLCLARETGAIVILTLAAVELWRCWHAREAAVSQNNRAPGNDENTAPLLERGRLARPALRDPRASRPPSSFQGSATDAFEIRNPRSAIRNSLLLLAALLPLAAWFVYLRWHTGLWLGDRQFAEYNLWGMMNPVRWLMQLAKRLYQLCIANFHWVATLLVFFDWRFDKRSPDARHSPLATRHLLLITGGIYTLLMSIVGGAPLTRYLLPVFPLLFLLAADALFRLPRWPRAVIALGLPIALIASWFWNPPYPFGFEDNLAYVDFIRVQQAGVRMLEPLPPETRILSAWPATDELLRPWLGYSATPRKVVRIEDFSEQALNRLSGEEFDAVLLFSRQWNPEWFARHPLLTRVQARYFGYQPQAPSSYLADKFGLRLFMRTEIRGQWVEIWVKRRINSTPARSVVVDNNALTAAFLRYLTCKSILYESVCGQSDPA